VFEMAVPAEVNIEVQAHTDAVGSAAYNQVLSDKRATSVLEYLVGKGVARTRLTSVGFGESRSIADNETEEGRSQNRRVEFRRTD